MSCRVVFLGAPGAGKGTQARALAKAWGVPQVATGDLLREAVAAGTALGREAQRYMEDGALVPDAVVVGLVGERLACPDAAAGFVLDGFPRTVAQAEALEGLLAVSAATSRAGTGIDRVVFFDVEPAELVRRLTGRRTCAGCGAAFHVDSVPPTTVGRCDACGGELRQRADDRGATVTRRLEVYREQTAPLLDRYARAGVLRVVEGAGSIDAVRRAVQDAVGELVR